MERTMPRWLLGFFFFLGFFLGMSTLSRGTEEGSWSFSIWRES